MNNKDLLATLVKALSDAAAKEGAVKPPRRSPKQNLAKAPPKMGRNTGRAQGLIGMTTMVPKRVYKVVVEHCRENQITISYFLRTLIDANLGTDMTGVVAPKAPTEPIKKRAPTHRAQPRRTTKPKGERQKPGRKPAHPDEEIAEYIELFHKENPTANAEQIFTHLRKEYKMRFSHNRAMAMLKKIRAQMLNGKSENIG